MGDSTRSQRQVKLLGQKGIRKIRDTTVGIVGLSGNGVPVALGVVCAGFRNLKLFDPDKLRTPNLNRFLGGGIEDIGKYKVDLVRDAVMRLDPTVHCDIFRLDARSPEARRELATCDVVLACVDNDATRISLQEFCAKRKLPLIEIGCGVTVRKNQVRMFGCKMSYYTPGNACLHCVSIGEQSAVQSHQSFVALNFVAAGLALLALVGHVTGRWETKNFVEFNALEQEMTSMHVEKRPWCHVCGQKRKEQ